MAISNDIYKLDIAYNIDSIANLHFKHKEYSLAESEYEKALRMYREIAIDNPQIYNKNIASILNMLAYCYYYLGKLELVLPTIEEAININPNGRYRHIENPLAELYDSKGELLMLMGKTDEAKEVYDKIIEMEPTYFDNNPTEFYKMMFE